MRIVVDGLPYPVIVSGSAAAEAAALVAADPSRAIVVCDRNVQPRGVLIAQALQRAGCDVLGVQIIDAGERRKRWKSVAALHEAFIGAGVDRASLVMAVGGGTLIDVAGFAAATYMRGVRWLPVATTLLGMVDAAIGGKTGVDLPQGKNLIGAIWQPVAVVADLAALSTLPAAHAKTGMAEIIKAAIIGRPRLLDAVVRQNLTAEPEAWAELVAEAASVKVRVVASDQNDRGSRAALNLGHTVAHAIEQASNYRVSHGAAVAVGLRAAGVLARERTGWSQADHRRVLAALRHSRLGLRLPKLSDDAIIAAMRTDKKRVNGRLRFVLPVRLGEVATGIEISEDDVRAALGCCTQAPRRGGW